ncbi:hypothetical protein [uncultured Peptoniphilus sp.]|uniref:hypothetical protein n=1 Tax=uncultured Peptoniphilus sp. TaxID=254354 RepID=UPI00261B191A|nr:hypothetical protein [uncultured Peptoniphilus sp.]
MKFFILFIFIINSIYNFNLRRKNLVSVKLERKFLFILAIFTLVVFAMPFKFSSKSILDFILAFSSLVLLFSIISSPGIRQNGFNIFMGSTTLIKFLPFDKIKNIKINYSDDKKIILSLDAFSNSHKLTFDVKDKNKIENLIANFL